MDALQLLASLGLTEVEQVQPPKEQAVLVLNRAQLRISEAQERVALQSATLQATAKALATAKELGVDLILPSDVRPLANAKRSLVAALKWADSKDYRPRAVIAAERAGTSEGRKAKEEIRQQIRFLWKLYNRATDNGDEAKATSLEKELEALYRGRKLVACKAGKVRARSGRKCPYSAEGKSKRSYKLVIEQSCRVTAVTKGAKLSLPTGKAPAKFQGEQESAARLDAMGERLRAPKRRVKAGKL